jgi:4-amino-4-deoxy-L-arabinose transferase-like glycosyltransferase
MFRALISTREAVAWLAAFLVVAALLVQTRFESTDPDSSLYAALAERLAERPVSEWIAPWWWGLWDGAGLFREHPAGVMIPPAALGALGVPARQAAYVMGTAWGLVALLLMASLVARLTSPREGRWALVLLQIMPVAFVFRIRANHEYPMLVCLLVALIGIDGVRRSWRWLLVLPLALTAALLIKGAFVVLVMLAAGVWTVTNPTREPGAWHRPVVSALVGVGVMALAVLAYDVAYHRVTGETFWVSYWQRQLAPLTIATPLDGGSVLVDHVAFYVRLIAWHPAPWSLALVFALWRWRRGLSARWQALTGSERRGLIFALTFAAVAILVLSPSSRFAERYAFSATYAVGAAGVVVALRDWPWLVRGLQRLDDVVPALPAVVWLALMLLRLAAGGALPRV